jgi:hypothetical protein
MSHRPAASGIRILVVVIVVAALLVSATVVLTFPQKTVTETRTATSDSTITQTLTNNELCDQNGIVVNSTYVYSTNCGVGVALILGLRNESIPHGSSEIFTIALRNDLDYPDTANMTGVPSIIDGFNASRFNLFNYTLPQIPLCGYGDHDSSGAPPAFLMIFNSSGYPVRLSNLQEIYPSCPYLGRPAWAFNASQTDQETLNVNGSWQKTGLNASASSLSYSDLAPGRYTAVAIDEWGDQAAVSFTVGPFPPATLSDLIVHWTGRMIGN